MRERVSILDKPLAEIDAVIKVDLQDDEDVGKGSGKEHTQG
jgi:hypothetical protein